MNIYNTLLVYKMEVLLTNDISLKRYRTKKNNKKSFYPLSNHLSDTKKKLDKYSNACDVLRMFDPFKKEKYAISKNINGTNITNAWLKCYEILSKYDFLSNNKEIYHFDNASLPGSFILATHHYFTTLYPEIKYSWKASSLYDTSESKDFLGDTYELYKNYPENWMMTDDINGDMTDLNVICKIGDQFINKKVNLYTSDLGFDISDNYENQEESHMRANSGQILLCLDILENNGNCIIKHYTFFCSFTRTYLFLFSKLFEKCYIYKPISSKQLNSEVYIIGLNFMNRPDEQKIYFDKLHDLLTKNMQSNHDYFHIHEDDIKPYIFEKFTNIIYEPTCSLFKEQINRLNIVINFLQLIKEKNLDMNYARSLIFRKMAKDKQIAINHFYKLCVLKKIDDNKKLNVKSVY
jgi:hypothetical protein